MSEEVKADKAEADSWKPLAIENKPTWELPSPFEVYDNPDWGRYDRGPHPLTRFELTMYQLSWALRCKPEWQRKAADLEIRGKWRQEALEQQAGSRVPLTERMSDYVLAELDGYAKIADNERGIERVCFQAIWHSDRLIGPDVLERLKTAVKTLEDVPDGQKDWYPGSNNQVLDLVHPSLYCVVYGRTHAYLPGEPRIAANFLPVHAPEPVSEFTSKDFSWLPSDFTVDNDGSFKLASSYINNVHPVLHQPLYHVIEEVLTGFIPMFEHVLGDSNKENNRLPFSDGDRLEEISCICHATPRLGRAAARVGWDATRDSGLRFPGFSLGLRGAPVSSKRDFRKSRFAEGPFNVSSNSPTYISLLSNLNTRAGAGMSKEWSTSASSPLESMCAAFFSDMYALSIVQYYDEENITESQLSFRVAVGEPEYHVIDDRTCTRMLYNMDRDDELIQRVGAVVTKAGRALAWPNLFQHCVSPFALADPSKPGHRKILAFFLVDPTKDRILSATDVPPQQADWAAAAFQEACRGDTSALGALPQELRELVKNHFPETVMTRKEAEAYRLELMAERTASVETHERAYVQTFNMCEH
ncbi:hypothetical protein B0H14DRAFT_2667905 [Mycena olivaceomarginata]|nr:hypothetical protein B0H14DRAFT_2667905 [Mycena olivaceomarginata]